MANQKGARPTFPDKAATIGLGLCQNFFLSAREAPEVTAKLWEFAKAAYFDTPMPSLFKERLFVYLSRFCQVRYCIVRHCAFLLGYGHAAGDPAARAQTAAQAIRLLKALSSVAARVRRRSRRPGRRGGGGQLLARARKPVRRTGSSRRLRSSSWSRPGPSEPGGGCGTLWAANASRCCSACWRSSGRLTTGPWSTPTSSWRTTLGRCCGSTRSLPAAARRPGGGAVRDGHAVVH